MLLGGIEPAQDIAHPGAEQALAACRRVIAITPFADPAVMDIAQVMLPMGSFAETSGSYVNVEGRWQEFQRLRAAGRRVAAGLEDPARARQPARARGIRLREFGGRACGTARDLRTTLRYDGKFPARREFKAERRGSTHAACRSTAWTRSCAARRRCSDTRAAQRGG